MSSPKRAKLNKEVEEIKRLRDLNTILKTGDLENALLSNAAKDSETLNDSVLDSMLQKADTAQRSEKGLEVIERLITANRGTMIYTEKKSQISKAKGKVKVRHTLHMTKKKKSSSKKTKKTKRR